VVTAILASAAPAAAGGGYEGFVACEYTALWGEKLPTHHCQLKMKKAAFFRSLWDFPIDWRYCVRYPASTGDDGHHHRLSKATRLLPAYTECFPEGDAYYVAQPGQRYQSWLHSHRRGKHWVYWYVLFNDGWHNVRSWWFDNALHFHV